MPNDDGIEEVYLESPNTCPYCMGSLQARGFTSDTHVGFVNTWCDDCHAEFTETFRLESVEVTKVGCAIKEKNYVIHPVLFDHLEKTLQSTFKGETNKIDFSVEAIFDDGVSMMIDVREVEGEPSYAMATLYKGCSDVGVVSDLLNELERVWELLYEGVLYKVDVTRGG